MYAIRILSGFASHGRMNASSAFFQSANYATVKPVYIEEKLGLPERPRKPPSPYLMYVKQTYPEYANMRPKMSFREMVKIVSERWKQVDSDTKSKMMNEYHAKLHEYPEALKKYYDSLTDAQRVKLEAARQDKKESKKKRQAMMELRKNGKPTRPVSSFGIFFAEQHSKDGLKHSFGPTSLKEISKKWSNMPAEEKIPYKTKYQEAFKVYEKKLAEWEEQMVREGKDSLIRTRSRPLSTGTPKKLPALEKSMTETGSQKTRSK